MQDTIKRFRLTRDERVRAWHFCADGKLRDGQTVMVGKTYTVEPPLVMCQHGLHWSRRIVDALYYAPGDTICLVEAWGDVQEQGDKGVSTHRKVIAMIDGTGLLRLFAADCAEDALRLYGVTDNRSWKAIEVSRKYANGKATKEELAAAWEAAKAAAWEAAWEAAGGAAWYAAWYAASEAAWYAASEVARAAANVAAGVAAGVKASDAARETAWEAAIVAESDAASDAAWYAARVAAREAAREAQNKRLTASVLKAMKLD